MKTDTLKEAVQAADLFIQAAVAVEHSKYNSVEPGKNSGTLRRASMELTRRLADLRQNR